MTTGGDTGVGDDTRPRSDGAAILAAVRAIGSATDSYRRAVVAEFGLGTADLVALSLLQREEPQQAGRIGDSTGLTPGSVTALLGRLEDAGYLTRIRTDHDRRSLEVRLTPAGRALGNAVIDAVLPAMERIADELGPDGCKIVLTAFEKISATLNALAVDPQLRLPGPTTTAPSA